MTQNLTHTTVSGTALPASVPRAETALSLGFDGCLVDAAQRPGDVYVPETLGAFLDHLHTCFSERVCIVTGRPADDVLRHIPNFKGPVYGNNGSEVCHEGLHTPLIENTTEVGDIANIMRDFCDTQPDLEFEQTPVGLAMLSANGSAKRQNVRSFLSDLSMVHPDLNITETDTRIELKPIGVDRGQAISDATERFGWVGKTIFHFGAEASDESAFQALAQLGGCGVKVGGGPSAADFSLKSPHEVHCVLAAWANGG